MAIDIGRLVREKASNLQLSFKELVSSPECEKYMTSLIDSVSGRYTDRVKLSAFWGKPEDTAGCTNNQEIFLNLNTNLLKTASGLRGKFKILLGILFHELAHVLFCDFANSKKCMDAIAAGEFPADPPGGDPDDVAALKAVLKRNGIQRLYADLENIVIDDHDENKMIERYSFSGSSLASGLIEQCLLGLRVILETKSTPVDDLLGNVDMLNFIVDMIFQYTRFEHLIVRDVAVLEDPTVKLLSEYIPDIDKARTTDSTEERFSALNRIVLRLWQYATNHESKDSQSADNGDSSEQQAGGQEQDSSGQQGASGQGDATDQSGESAGQSGKQDGVSDDQAQDHPQSTEASGQSPIPQPGASGSEENDQGSSSAMSGGSSDKGDHQQTSSSASSSGDSQMAEEEIQEACERIAQAVADAMKNTPSTPQPKGTQNSRRSQGKGQDTSDGADPSTQEGKPSGEIPGKTVDAVKDGDTGSSDDALARAVNALVNAIKTQAAMNEVQKALDAETLQKVQAIEFNNGHKGVPLIVNTIPAPSAEAIRAHRVLLSEVKGYSDRLQRLLKQELEDFSRGTVQRHRQFGPGIDARDAYRPDQKFYVNKKLPQDLPEMAVSVLIDLSGSMYGNRLDSAKRVAVLLQDFCRGLRIPVMVCGHNSDYLDCHFHIFSDFEEVSPTSRAKVAMAVADGCNRDGMALKVACELLAKRPEQIKMQFIISDGQPAAYMYGGQPAAQDIQSVVKDARKRGVEVFAAAIGSDKPTIERIYKEGFIDISDLSKLPKTLTAIVKKRILNLLK